MSQMIGEVLRDWRHRNFVTVRDASKEIGISSATLSRIENGKTMDGRIMMKLIRFLFEGKK